MVTSLIRGKGLGLEIGASYNPLFPKRAGHVVRTLDHATRDDLIAKYAAIGMPQHQLDAIEDVDYVWRGESLVELVGPDTRFDYIVASHVVEHTTDLVGFVNDCAEILTPEGVLCLVVPDKRFCFDRFRPHSSVGQVLQAHLAPSDTHPVAPFIDTHLYAAHRLGSEPTWTATTTDGPRLVTQDWHEVGDTIARVGGSREYVDIHRWTFTPTSFRLLVDDLVRLGYLRLGIASISETNGFEFYVALDRASASASGESFPPNDERRLVLLCEIERELAEQSGAGAEGEVRRELAEAKAELGRVYRSTSWRATAPLRQVTARVRTFRMPRP